LRRKDFWIAQLIVIIVSIIFVLSGDALYLLIPSVLFSGTLGGIYVGYFRKRPLISCVYDGMLLGFPAGFLQASAIIPILWFYHGQNYDVRSPISFVFLIFTLCIMTVGLVGAPFGGLLIGLFYRYLRADRGEVDLYESYLETKTQEDCSPLDELSD